MAMAGSGEFVVIWASDGSAGTDSSASSIQGQRFFSGGSPAGEEFQVNIYTTGSQSRPSAALTGAGELFLVWQSAGSSGTDTSLESIEARHYASDGSGVGGELQVNSYTTSSQVFPAASSDGAGHLLAVWESLGSEGTDTDGWSIQRTPVGWIFADGF
ncbi:MAG: hypothetical protein GY719_22785, partial [bacterium]|nr:hypothetical protein [bacterium]